MKINESVKISGNLQNLLYMVSQDNETPLSTVKNAGGTIDAYGVYELVQASTVGKPCFALKLKKKPLGFVKEVELPNQKLKVLPLEKAPWTLPTEPLSYANMETLWSEVKQCLYEHLDLPDSAAYDVLTSWVFASWLLEKWQIAPYLFFFGTFGTGKTRALEVLSKLCSRGWLALYCTPASLYRPIENWKPTIFLDESECYGSQHEILGLLNGSYRRGQFVARQRENEGDYETEFFDCFSFKAIAGTKDLAKTLRSRCIIFQTSHATRKIKFFVDEKKCTELRNKLLIWRMTTLLEGEGSELSEDAPEASLEALVETVGNQREVELFYPLLAVAPNKEIYDKLINYAKASASRKLEEMSLTAEATCLSAILTCKQTGKIENARILIQDITAKANENLSYEEAWKERFTSSLCSRLGFQKSRGAKGKAVIVWSQPLIDRLRKDQRYSLCFATDGLETPSESSEPSNDKPPQPPITPYPPSNTENQQ